MEGVKESRRKKKARVGPSDLEERREGVLQRGEKLKVKWRQEWKGKRKVKEEEDDAGWKLTNPDVIDLVLENYFFTDPDQS